MYQQKRMVQSSEIGYKHVLRLKDLIDMIQDVEGLHIDSLKALSTFAKEASVGIFLNYRHVVIKKLPRVMDLIELTTYPYETNAFFGFRNTIIKDSNQQPLIETNCLGSFVSLATNRPYRLTKEVLDSIYNYPKYDMDYLSRKITLDGLSEPNYIETICVRQSHIDQYMHMNNAFYVEFAENLLPDDYAYNQLRCEYRLPFKKGDDILLYAQHDENRYVITLCNKENVIHAVVEFSTY